MNADRTGLDAAVGRVRTLLADDLAEHGAHRFASAIRAGCTRDAFDDSAVRTMSKLVVEIDARVDEIARLRFQLERIGWYELTASEARNVARAALAVRDEGRVGRDG